MCSFLCASASLRDLDFVIASWSCCVTAARGRRSKEEQWGEFVFGHAAISRRDAETQRGWLCAVFLGVSAPLRDLDFVIANLSDSQPMILDQRKSHAQLQVAV